MKFVKIAGLLLGSHLAALSSSGQVKFSYDASGNRTERYTVVLKAPRVSSADEDKRVEDPPFVYRELRIYPNPTQGMVAVAYPAGEKECPCRYSVFTLAGVLVAEGQATDNPVQLDLSGQPSGIYVVRIAVGGSTYEFQLVKS